MKDTFEVLFCGTGAADHDWEHYGRRGVRGSCSTLLDGRVLVDCGATPMTKEAAKADAPQSGFSEIARMAGKVITASVAYGR